MHKLSGLELLRPIYSEGGFYVTIDCEKYMQKYNYSTSFELAKKILETKAVATVPGSDFGLPNTIRLSFSSRQYKEGINLLAEFFREGIAYDGE